MGIRVQFLPIVLSVALLFVLQHFLKKTYITYLPTEQKTTPQHNESVPAPMHLAIPTPTPTKTAEVTINNVVTPAGKPKPEPEPNRRQRGGSRNAKGKQKSKNTQPQEPHVEIQSLPLDKPLFQTLGLEDDGDQQERFVVCCTSYGRHNNQLIELAKSYSLAYHTGRTLVLPTFYHKFMGDEGTHPAEYFYDISNGPVKVITAEEWQTAQREGGNNGTSGVISDALCVDHDRRCPILKNIHCKTRIRPKQTDIVTLIKAGRSAKYSVVVTGGENTFFSNVPHTPCMYSYLQLQPHFKNEVARYLANTALPKEYLAIHLRNFENRCGTLGKKHAKARALHGLGVKGYVTEVLPMCAMKPSYYRRFWNEKGMFFVAHDRQSPKTTYHNLSADGAAFYKSEEFTSEEGMVIEFWLCVHAKVFVGNAFSTLSLNICAARRAIGKNCTNLSYIYQKFPCFPHPDFERLYQPLAEPAP
eukprot:TRINITY_DN69816_c0_g1_i1.p1 TRINITY_DN69816_c0_g1~~TRINITY_DN69816_c0_g1_i1.p1  ORF type:complete len:472 (-),score=14.79 TRINITY_DN69816_c0_g1_i1:122-1537(-)